MVGYDTLENFLRTNWALVQHHKWNFHDIENMIAWERQVFVVMLTQYLKDEQDRIRLEQQTRRR
jgi:hypothetical protein